MDTNADSDTDRAIKAVLDELAKRLEAVRRTNIGWPAASDVDFSALSRFFDRHLLNNLGDPFATGAYPQHTKALEAEVVNVVADLMRIPADDRWGYVTAGAGEGNLYALHLARSLHSKGVVYYSEAAHYSVDKAVDLLCMPSIRLPSPLTHYGGASVIRHRRKSSRPSPPRSPHPTASTWPATPCWPSRAPRT